MNEMEIFFLAVFAVLCAIGIRMVIKNGLIGSMLGGKIDKTYGEIYCSLNGMASHRFQVHRLNRDNQSEIALVYKQGTVGGGKMIPVKLTKSEASKLSRLLSEAANEI